METGRADTSERAVGEKERDGDKRAGHLIGCRSFRDSFAAGKIARVKIAPPTIGCRQMETGRDYTSGRDERAKRDNSFPWLPFCAVPLATILCSARARRSSRHLLLFLPPPSLNLSFSWVSRILFCSLFSSARPLVSEIMSR